MLVTSTRTALLLIFMSLTSVLLPAHANLDTAAQYVTNPQMVGKGRLKVMFWNVFDATLYADGGRYDADKPFALSLSYLRKLEGGQIVDKTMTEISRQSSPDAASKQRWAVALREIIPNVNASTTITGVRDEQANTLFFKNGELIGRIDDPAFTRAFFDIWLGSDSSKPSLTRQLTGQMNS